MSEGLTRRQSYDTIYAMFVLLSIYDSEVACMFRWMLSGVSVVRMRFCSLDQKNTFHNLSRAWNQKRRSRPTLVD